LGKLKMDIYKCPKIEKAEREIIRNISKNVVVEK
jgi:hypothetical protein